MSEEEILRQLVQRIKSIRKNIRGIMDVVSDMCGSETGEMYDIYTRCSFCGHIEITTAEKAKANERCDKCETGRLIPYNPRLIGDAEKEDAVGD